MAIAQINKKLDNLIRNVGALMKEPLESAKYFMKQSITHFE